MKKLNINTGMETYEINGGEANGGGVLRFNPSDPNVYNRFYDAQDKISAVENELVEKGKAISANDDQTESAVGAVRLMADADRQVKAILAEVFGEGNDFNAMLGGVNMMAVATNGERVVTNLLNALLPIVQAGAEQCTSARSEIAVTQAKANRAQRRAAVKS